MNLKEILGLCSIVVIGATLRLYQLGLPPLHHDEGVNGYFMLQLAREGTYRYDPANYHGPSLYYLDLPLLHLLGLETFNLRLLPALFGIALLVVVACARITSRRAAHFSALLVAVSPGMVYISRYFIHEMLVVFFTCCTIASLLRRRSGTWTVCGAVSAGLLFATKETALPTICVIAMAGALTWAIGKISLPGVSLVSPAYPSPEPTRPALSVLPAAMVSTAVFVGVQVPLFTSFFTNSAGIWDAFTAFAFWTATGTKDHLHPLWQYLSWMLQEEAGILLLGAAGISLALYRRNEPLLVFCSFWSLGMLSMYSLIPYKTPWLTVNIILPFAVMAGYALDEILRNLQRHLGMALAAVVLAVGLAQSISLNFINYDDNRYPYIYAHTVRDVHRLDRDVERLVERGGKEPITVVAPEYWPLPWMWRDYDVAFYGEMVPLDGAPVVVSSAGQEGDVRKAAGGSLLPAGSYTLRPGVELIVWTRK